MTISLKELSHRLGLSQTTVSRALNGYPEVSEITRQRVVKAAEEFQYRPNPRARSLATGKSLVIGHVLPLMDRNEVVNPIFGDFLLGAGEVYASRGYSVHLSFPPPREETDHYKFLARQRMFDGVIIHSPRPNDERLRVLRDLGVVFGVHGQLELGDDDYNFVEMDNRAALVSATSHLVELGHERIAMLNGPRGLSFSTRREEGFLEVMAAAGLVPNRLWMHYDEMSESYGYWAAQGLLNQPTRPTAFLTGSILVAMGVRRAVLERGLRVPQDVSIVTHDDVLSYLPNDDTPPVFTCTRSSVRYAGSLLAGIILDQIDDPDTPPRGETLRAELVPGQSSGPAPR